MKLDPTKKEYDQEFSWVAHPDALYYVDKFIYGVRQDGGNDIEKMLVQRRYDLEIIGGVQDNEADYSYDDWALCLLDNQYYLLSTSGCSCPSPRETWRLEIGPATLAAIEQHVKSGAYAGYTLPKKQEADFIKLLNDEAARNCSK